MRRVCEAILDVLLIVLTPAIVAAEAGGGADREAARQRFLRGVELIQQERWEEGLEAFRDSYELYPTQSALFNRALCLRLLRRYAEAMDVLTEHRRLYADSVPASRRAEVEREIATIRELVGRLEVQLEGASSAEVYIDDERAGPAPTAEPLILAPGQHSVEVRAPGFQTYRQSIALSSGEDITLTASMARAADNAEISPHRQEVEVAPGQPTGLQVQLAPGAEDETPRGGRTRSLIWAGVAIGAVGVAALAAGVALLVWNNGRVDDWAAEDDRLRRVLAEYQQNPELYVWEALDRQIEANDQLSDSIQTTSVVAPVLIGLGGAALVAGATLLGLGLRRRPAESARLRVSPTLGGLVLSGSFSSF